MSRLVRAITPSLVVGACALPVVLLARTITPPLLSHVLLLGFALLCASGFGFAPGALSTMITLGASWFTGMTDPQELFTFALVGFGAALLAEHHLEGGLVGPLRTGQADPPLASESSRLQSTPGLLATAKVKKSPSGSPPVMTGRLLILEHNLFATVGLDAALRPRGIAVRAVERPVDAFEEIDRFSPGAILVDAKVPDVTKAIRTILKNWPQTPLILTSWRDDEIDLDEPLLGQLQMIHKPYSPDALENALARARRADASEVRRSSVELLVRMENRGANGT